MKYYSASLSLLLCTVVSTTVTVVTANEPVCLATDEQCQIAHTEVQCGVYMAPSTIGVANMGIYTAVDVPIGQAINFPEIAIPLLFRDWGYHGRNPDGTLWDRYIWDHGVANIEPKKSDLAREDSGAVFVPGVGCTINSRLEMLNIQSTHGSQYDTAGLHRSKDPGSGAFSPYHHSETTAHRPLIAGEELFAAYGDTWIPHIPGAVVTMDENMDETDEFIEEYASWVAESGLSEEAKEGLWTLTKEFPTKAWIFGALPQASWKEVADFVEEPNSKTSNSTSRHFVDVVGQHSLEWLQEYGKCQDHLKPGRSTIAQAGRGAFANRDLPKGTVIGYSPLVHIGNAREILELKYKQNSMGTNYTMEDMIINYSFGHKDSTVLLTPYGAMVNYINHHRERANVKVVWPSKELVAHKPDWLNKDIEFLRNVHEKIGLSFDYVALRDLEEGEEIFMDYGDDWIAAWDEHVKNWKPLPNSEKYVHSTAWTEPHLRTLEELSDNPYPPNLHTLCRESYKQEGDTNIFVPVLRAQDDRRYCDVLERTPLPGGKSYKYTVKMYIGDSDIVIVEGVTNKGVAIYDKLQSADWHLPNSFRHPMAIPDDVLPESWRNNKKVE